MSQDPARHNISALSRFPLSSAAACAWVFAFVVPGAACGGTQADGSDEPGKPEIEMRVPTDDEPPAEEGISPETFDSIKRFFERKNQFLNTCFTSAISAGELPKRGSARIAVTVTITRAGKITKPKVTAIKPNSETLRTCIFEKMALWQLPKLPEPLDYSHTFGFETL